MIYIYTFKIESEFDVLKNSVDDIPIYKRNKEILNSILSILKNDYKDKICFTTGLNINVEVIEEDEHIIKYKVTVR